MFQSILSAAGYDPNSWMMYLLYGIVVAFISSMSVYYIVVSLRRAKKLGMDMGKIKKVITTSITYSILPAIGIGIGVVTLIGAIGIALPSIRLSVIGSLQYESMMANGAAGAIMGGDTAKALQLLISKGVTAKDFVTIATVMTIPIVTGPLLVLIGYKRFQPKVAMLTSKSTGAAGGGINLGELAFQVIFIGMILGYLAMSLGLVASDVGYIDSWYNFIAIIVAALCMYVFEFLINKVGWKWLDSFSTAFSMLIAMAVVAVISYYAIQNGWEAPDPDAVAAAASLIA